MNADHDPEGQGSGGVCSVFHAFASYVPFCVARMTWALGLQGPFPGMAYKSYFTTRHDLWPPNSERCWYIPV